jgi:DNA mismatch repair ATPase MutS
VHTCCGAAPRAGLRSELHMQAGLIDSRLDAVEELTANNGLFYGLQSILEGFPDLEQVTS